MTRIITGAADVTAGSPNVVWTGDPLSAVNCPADSAIMLDGAGYYVQSLTDTTHVVLTRNYSGTTAAGIPAEISAWTAAEVQTAVLNQRTATLLQSLAVPLTGVPMVFGGIADSEADPGTGAITFDDADAPTVMRISKTASGGYGSIAGILDALDDSTNTVARSVVSLRPTDGALTFTELNVTGAVVDHTTYVAVPVTMRGGTVPANGGKLAFSAEPSGEDGTDGIFTAVASRSDMAAATDDAKGVTPLKALQGAGVWSRVMPQGRLTLVSGVAVPESDVAGATTIYWTPAGGDLCPVFDGTAFVPRRFSELALALDANTGHTIYQGAGQIHDLWLADVDGDIYFGTARYWNANTSRGTGAGTDEVQVLDGIPTNKYDLLLRHGAGASDTVTVPANQATLLGSIYMTANGQTEDSKEKRYVSNRWNATPRKLRRVESGTNHTYSTATLRQYNANSANKVSVLNCTDGRITDVSVTADAINSAANWIPVETAIGLDSTTSVANDELVPIGWAYSTIFILPQARYVGFVGLGLHDLNWLEFGGGTAGTDTITWRHFPTYGLAGTHIA